MTTTIKSIAVAIGMIVISQTSFAQINEKEGLLIEGQRPERVDGRDAPDRTPSSGQARTQPAPPTFEERVQIEVKKRMANLSYADQAAMYLIGRSKYEKNLYDIVFNEFQLSDANAKDAADRAEKERRAQEEKVMKQREERPSGREN